MRTIHEIFAEQLNLSHPVDVLDPAFDEEDEPTFDWVDEELEAA